MSAAPAFPSAASCDIMLLLEGTFPYVSGGVSSWVNQIIRGFPEYSFGVCFLGSRREDYGDMRYQLPANVVHLECHYIHDMQDAPKPAPQAGDRATFDTMTEFHSTVRGGNRAPAAATKARELFARLLPELDPGAKLDESAFLHSRASWDYITAQYREHCTDPSFVDYFWTIRIMHAPVWRMVRVAKNLIPARAYHTVSTGYAGFLGAILKAQTGKPLLLSEHGIYTKERKIDLFQSEWIKDNRGVFEKDASQVSYFRELWIRFFEALGRMCYEASDQIVALYEANRLRQLADGAEDRRTMNIPNGVDLQRLAALRSLRPAAPPRVLCLIGRVVPIKDVKTFVRAMRTVVNLMPDAEGWIAGPEDEAPEYAAECRNIALSLGLEKSVKFLGFQKIDELMPKIGLVVLSSISEALPLVILEGYAAGVPSVATDGGSCRQLIFGLSAADRALGAAGDVVRIADAPALAQAAVALLSDPLRWAVAQAAGIARVERYYTQDLMFGEYRAVYRRALATPADSAADKA